MKKFGLLFSTLVMIMMFAFSANALEATGQCGENVTYTYNSTTQELVIKGTGAMYNYANFYNSSRKSPFYDSDIETVIIEYGVTTIGEDVFSGCDNLTSITIPESVTTICNDAFRSCDYLTSLTLPDSVTTIGVGAFESCTRLTSITIPGGVTKIGERVFRKCSSLTNIIIPEGVTSIGRDAFIYCYNLANITISDSVTSIQPSAFYATAYYNDIANWENDVLYIGKHLIEANTIISGDYTIKNGTLTIAYGAFYNCDDLTSITIPNSVTTIGGEAFSNCDSLVSITIGDSVTTIGSSAFYNCKSLTKITIDKNNTAYSSDSLGVLFDKNKTLLIQYPTGNANASYIIPDNVTAIDANAFYGCKSLTSVIIGDSVTTIGDSAFFDCDGLTSVTIPDSATTISGYAFCECTNLISVTIGDGVTTIGDYAFCECTNLASVTIGNGVTSIGNCAFIGCISLSSITIPDSVTTIGNSAFDNCTSFTDVYYMGTEEQWNKINIGSNNSNLLNATIHFKHKHNFTIKVLEEATHLKEGIGVYTCECGDTYYEPISKLKEHTYISTVTKEPTHLEEGILTYTCECGDTYTEVIPKVDYQVGDIIQFGSYPQSKVTDSAIITALNNKAPAWDNWTSYGYYTGMGPNSHGTMQQGDWMRYTDVIYNGNKYRGVKFTQYRPYYTYYQSSASNTYQDDNGYSTDIVYWFKFEPITWRVLDSVTGLVMCETIIDSQPYSNTLYKNSSVSDSSYAYFNDPLYKNYASDYETSSIRQWLNDDFYNTAFTDSEKKEINTTTLNNDGYYTSIGTTGYEKFDSNSTNDKIFLLSYNEVRNSDFGFNSNASAYNAARLAWGSDYAQSQGVYVSGNSGSSYENTSMWLLRSPGDKSHHCCHINNAGYAYNHFSTYNSQHGIRPALCFNEIKNYNHQHTYTSEITTPATHLTEGVETYTCECGDTYTEPLAKLEGHTYKAAVTEPTCTVKGYTTYTCECGDSYVSDYVGTKEHSYTSTVTRPSTHLTEGVRTYTCSACGDSYTEAIAKTKEHSYFVLNIVEPTCEAEGYTTYMCECGHTYNGDKKAATGHNYSGDTCVDCGESKTENCSCNCHKGGISGFFWKILRFFYKLFGMNKTCGCGVSHY